RCPAVGSSGTRCGEGGDAFSLDTDGSRPGAFRGAEFFPLPLSSEERAQGRSEYEVLLRPPAGVSGRSSLSEAACTPLLIGKEFRVRQQAVRALLPQPDVWMGVCVTARDEAVNYRAWVVPIVTA